MAWLCRIFRIGPLLAAASLLCCHPAASAGEDEPQLSPFLVRTDLGWIDWQQGLVYGVGKASLPANGDSKLRAMRAATAAARASIVKLAYGIQLNDKDRIETYDGGRLAISVEAFIKDSEVAGELVETDTEPHYKVTRVAPLSGIDGLTGAILPRLGAGIPPSALSEADSAWEDEEDRPWLLLDARHLKGAGRVTPALFPRILSASGEILYRLSSTDPRAVRRHGMAQYVTSDARLGHEGQPGAALGDPGVWIGRLLGVGETLAEDGGHRKKRRKYVVQKAEDVEGLTNTNLVVSEQDAQRLKQEDSSSEILKKCRVIVVVSGVVGGVEGRLPEGSTHLVRVER